MLFILALVSAFRPHKEFHVDHHYHHHRHAHAKKNSSCSICTQVINYIKNAASTFTFDEIMKIVHKCQGISSLSDFCNGITEDQVYTIVDGLTSYLDSSTICSNIGAC